MAITLDKTITRDSGNIINTDTNYSELNVKASGLVEDIVDHIETELTSAETQVNTQLTTLDNTITETLDSKNLTLQYKNDAQASAEQSASSASSASQIAIGQSTGRANIKPVLNLDFANQKRLDSKVDFTRTSTATYYDGKKQVKAEENLLRYSDFSSLWYGTQTLSIEKNTVTAPDGTLTAIRVTPNDTYSEKYINQTLNIVYDYNKAYTFSYYIKLNGFSYSLTRFYANGAWKNISFDLVNETIGTTQPEVLDWNILNVGNGWYKVSFTLTNLTTFNIFRVAGAYETNTHSNQGNGIDSFDLWHPQLEQRDFATAYTPTLDKPITNYIPVLSTAQANEPRFDYDLETKECKGLLIEEQRTNLISNSEDFKANSHTLAQVTIEENCNIDLLGNNNAFKLTGQNIQAIARINANLLENATYTFSFFCKNIDATVLNYRVYSNVETKDILPATSYLTQVTTDKFSRVTLTFTTTVAGSYSVYLQSGTFTGSAYFCGLQLEQGSFATSYIPTNGSQVTRVADNCSISGDNFSSFYRQGEGTLYLEADSLNDESNSGLLSISDGTFNNTINVQHSLTPKPYFVCKKDSLWQFSRELSVWESGSRKLAFSYKNNNISVLEDGSDTSKDTDCSIPTVNILEIGRFSNNDTYHIGKAFFKKVAYYDKALSDTELQLMTQG